jgi:hypothetical protein
MRYQERIYIQNQNSAVRNKDILNVNMSSDICVFENPLFSVSGASKLDCTGATSGTSYIISADSQTIQLDFNFTGNTSTFVDTNALFKFGVYKYNPIFSGFSSTPVFTSNSIDYPSFSATNTTTEYLQTSGLTLDGEYIIKGYYQFGVCTDYLGKLGKTIDTSTYIGGTTYGIYDNNLDYYFIAIKQADTPIFISNFSNSAGINRLVQQVILPAPNLTEIVITNNYVGDFILTLNGLVLAKGLDYTFSGQVVSLSGETVYDDIITVIYTSSGGNNLVGDNINITTPIISGASDGQGSNVVYYNTGTSKYELYTSVTPQNGDTIIVMVNGATLASGIDFYQSTSNQKRIILEGNLLVDDIITLVYFPIISVVNGLNTNTPMVTWKITNPPTEINGLFTLEVSTNDLFSSFYYTGTTDYVVGNTYYNQTFTASGAVGTQLYYRVKNEKNYTTICGDNLNSTVYSEIIPVVIQNNSINSY